METFTFYIQLDNAAFQYGNKCNEVARMMQEAARCIVNDQSLECRTLLDIDGNRVGEMYVTSFHKENRSAILQRLGGNDTVRKAHRCMYARAYCQGKMAQERVSHVSGVS